MKPPVPRSKIGISVSSDLGGWHAFLRPTKSPAHWCSGAKTWTLCLVNANKPSTTKLFDRIDVAFTESLLTRECHTRPCARGLNGREVSTLGNVAPLRSQLGSQPMRAFRFSFGPGA